MKAQTWYTIQGEAAKIETSTGSFTQMIEKLSMGVIWARRGGFTCRYVSASTAGWLMMSQSWLAKIRLARNATATPHRHLMMRERSSSRCSIKDMRSMPSSSWPSSDGGGGGGGGF